MLGNAGTFLLLPQISPYDFVGESDGIKPSGPNEPTEGFISFATSSIDHLDSPSNQDLHRRKKQGEIDRVGRHLSIKICAHSRD